MDNVQLILKNHGYKFTTEGNLAACPLCKSTGNIELTFRHFTCSNCKPEGTIVEQLFRELNIKIDTSPTDIHELLEKNIETLFNPELKGFKTGYSKLDYRTGGLLPDHLYILASETGMGKSVFSTNLIINISKDNHVSYYDLENGKLLMLKRFVSIASMRPVTIFDNPDNITEIIEAGEKMTGKITFRDQQMLEPYIGNLEGVRMAETICELIQDDVKAKETKVVVIDPLENFETVENNFAITGRVVELFKNLAQELHIAIVINHHLKKPQSIVGKRVANLSEVVDANYRIPTIYDLTGTSKITNKATDVWTIVRQKEDPDINKRGRMLLRFLKSREDRSTDSSDLYFTMNLNTLKITEVDFTHANVPDYPRPEVKM